jgi:hypothetical protein
MEQQVIPPEEVKRIREAADNFSTSNNLNYGYIKGASAEYLRSLERKKDLPITDRVYNLIEEDAMRYMRAEHPQSCSWAEIKKAYMAGAQDHLQLSSEAEKEGHVKLLNWFLENYMGVKGATVNQVPILVDKYLKEQNKEKGQ